MKLFTQLFGGSRSEVRPQVPEDARCPNCNKFLQNCNTRIEYAGIVYCGRECIDPKLIRETEAAERLAQLNRQQQANLADAAARDNRNKYLQESLALLRNDTKVRETLTRFGVNLAQAEESIDRQLNPYRRKYLPKGEKYFTVRHGANVIHIQATD